MLRKDAILFQSGSLEVVLVLLVVVALVVLAIAFPGTCYLVVVIRTEAMLAIVVFGVVPKVALSPGGGAALVRVFLL